MIAAERFELDPMLLKAAGKVLQQQCHGLAHASGWWTQLHTGDDVRFRYGEEPAKRNLAEALCLVHSEVSEAMEGVRKKLRDDKLPHRWMLEVELADVVIRCFDLAGGCGLDLAGAITEKLAFNAQRADHKPANRSAEGGKAF